jgi:DNA-binding response OmpR family regulator
MPFIDGLDLLRILRSNPEFDDTTIVMLTARNTVLTKVKSHMVGAQQFLGKPFRVEQIQAIVQGVVHQKQALRSYSWPSSGEAPQEPFWLDTPRRADSRAGFRKRARRPEMRCVVGQASQRRFSWNRQPFPGLPPLAIQWVFLNLTK